MVVFIHLLPSVSLNGGGGTGASLTAVVSVGGSGYTSAPTVTISNGYYSSINASNTATATATISGGAVSSIAVTNGGFYINSTGPSITISGGGGSGASARCVMTKLNGYYYVSSIVVGSPVNSITISNAGSGYTSPPALTFTQDMHSGGTCRASATIADADYSGVNYAYYKPITPYYTGYVCRWL